MKKKIFYITILVVVVSMLFTFSGCALLFNDGSEDELEGIWGISDVSFSGIYTHNYGYGADFEYYLIIINSDKSVTIRYKLVDKDEVSYTAQYTPTFDDTETEKVKTITLSKMAYISVIEYSSGESYYNIGEDVTELSFSPKLETLTYKDVNFKIENSSPHFVTTKITFKKIYSSTSNRKIEKAIKKQQDNRSERG